MKQHLTALTAACILLAEGFVTAALPPRSHKATTHVVSAVKPYTIEQFMKTIRFGGAALSPDEQTVLFSSNADGVFNLYEMPFAGGAPKQADAV